MIVAISAIWCVFSVLVGAGSIHPKGGMVDGIVVALIFGSPVIIFWTFAWILNWSIPFDVSRNSEWIKIDISEARRHPLYGHGWGLGFLGISQPLAAIAVVALTLSDNDWMDKVAIGLALKARVIWFSEVIMSIALCGYTMFVSKLIFDQDARFTKEYYRLLLIAFVMPYVDVVWASIIFDIRIFQLLSDMKYELVKSGARVFGVIITWGLYIKISRRVNVTYRHRVKRRDLPLVADDSVITPAADIPSPPATA